MGASLGDRMKSYEAAFDHLVTPRLPVIIRVDGRAFHTVTRGAEKPFDLSIAGSMDDVAKALMAEVQGAKLAYVQSDEVSVLVVYYGGHESQSWFGNRLQKMTSVAAGVATRAWNAACPSRPGEFDARVFALPEDDVCNYFLWRQRDAERNSLQGLAQSLGSPKELHGLKREALHDFCVSRGKNWNDLEAYWKRGRCVLREVYESEPDVMRTRMIVDFDTPRFGLRRDYIEQHLGGDNA